MLKQPSLIFILSFFIVSDLFSQNVLRNPIVSNSQVKKYQIKQATENWFHDSLASSAANTTIEKYNEFGTFIQRTFINYKYHKFVYDLNYDYKRNIIHLTIHKYDWNPYRDGQLKDTVYKKSTAKYSNITGQPLKYKPTAFDLFQPKLKHDSIGNLTERIDTIKCGYNTTYFTYDKKSELVERKLYTTQHSEKPTLVAVDSLQYNAKGELVMETNYLGIQENEVNWNFSRKKLTTFKYFENGLLMEKTTGTIYPSSVNNNFVPSVYRYEYEFY